MEGKELVGIIENESKIYYFNAVREKVSGKKIQGRGENQETQFYIPLERDKQKFIQKDEWLYQNEKQIMHHLPDLRR